MSAAWFSAVLRQRGTLFSSAVFPMGNGYGGLPPYYPVRVRPALPFLPASCQCSPSPDSSVRFRDPQAAAFRPAAGCDGGWARVSCAAMTGMQKSQLEREARAGNGQVASMARRGQWALQVAVLLAVVWLALDGLDNAFTGLFFVLMAAAVGAWLVPGEVHPWRPLRLLVFFFWFVLASWRGGIDVARRALAPSLPVSPTWHQHELALPPGLPRTVFVAVLSLLPGTLSVDLLVAGSDDAAEAGPNGQGGEGRAVADRLIVHALTADAIAGVAELERRIQWLFSLGPSR